jgi:tyrosine-protein phosphatase SIW14
MTQGLSRCTGLTLFLLLLFTMCTVEQPQAKGAVPPSPLISGRRKVTGIGNFGEVTPKLFRGAQPTRQGFQTLAKMGIDIVVDTRGNRTKTEGKEVHRLGMRYVAIPWHCPFPHDEVFARFLRLVRENPDKRIFVHCRLGDDRTGMMIAAYRMAVDQWTADKAMREMEQYGFTDVHHVICPTLASYEKNFPKRLETDPAFRRTR